MVCYVYNDLVYRRVTNLAELLTIDSIVYAFNNDYLVIDYFIEKKKKKNEGKIIFQEYIIPVQRLLTFEQLRVNDRRQEKKLVLTEIISKNIESGIQKSKKIQEQLKFLILKLKLETPHLFLILKGYFYYKFKNNEEFRTVINKWCNPSIRNMVLEIYGDVSFWDTSNITDMSNLFQNLDTFYRFDKNLYFDIENWNVSNVKNMSRMFYNFKYFNLNLSKWDVSNVSNMSYMFSKCKSLNQPFKWNTKNVKNMEYMFLGCLKFNSDIEIDLSQVRNLNGFLHKCIKFNRPVNHLNVSNCRTMKALFHTCNNFNQPLDQWDVSNVRYMSELFGRCYDFNQPLENWNINNVIDMTEMFYACCKFNQSLKIWDISNVENKNLMFVSCNALKDEFKPIGY
jgi:surface protein